jgi:hypothetical protein
MTTAPACSFCRFRHADARPEYAGAGECRRFPPTPTVTTGFDGSSQYEQHWPWMAASDWCGEFQAATVTPAVRGGNWKRFPDGKLKPFLEPGAYDELRYDDKFLYNRGPKPGGLT